MKKIIIGLLYTIFAFNNANHLRASELETINSASPSLTVTGLYSGYGCNPRKSAAECLIIERDENKLKDFNPKFFAVIYLKFKKSSKGEFIARHAYFHINSNIKTDKAGDNTKGKSPPVALDNLKCAVKFLKKNKPDREMCGVFTPKKGSKYKSIRYGFEGLKFGSKQKIYIVIDNANIKFNDDTPLSFTPFGAFDDPYNLHPCIPNNSCDVNSGVKAPNLSFFNARPSNIDGIQGLYVENYFYNWDGKPMTENDKDVDYSINFNLFICKDKVINCTFQRDEVIPIIIDPDTGNGWGNNP